MMGLVNRIIARISVINIEGLDFWEKLEHKLQTGKISKQDAEYVKRQWIMDHCIKIHNVNPVCDDGYVYIGRTSILGNPYPITPECSREISLSKFKRYAQIQMESKSLQNNFKLAVDSLLQQIILQKSIKLVCYCHPLFPCHGNVIKELIRDTLIKGEG